MGLSKVWKWIKIVVSPFFMLLLIPIPFDFHTSLFWMGGLIAFGLSMANILNWLNNFYRYHFKNEMFPPEPERLRSVLTASFFVLVITCHILSAGAANEFARVQGKRMQEECLAKKACSIPQDLLVQDWHKPADLNADRLNLRRGRLGSKYRVMFRIKEKGQSFWIYVHHNIDNGYEVEGGVTQPFKYGRYP